MPGKSDTEKVAYMEPETHKKLVEIAAANHRTLKAQLALIIDAAAKQESQAPEPSYGGGADGNPPIEHVER